MRYQRGIAYVRRWDEFEHGLMGDHSTPRMRGRDYEGLAAQTSRKPSAAVSRM